LGRTNIFLGENGCVPALDSGLLAAEKMPKNTKTPKILKHQDIKNNKTQKQPKQQKE
jgi:hypothetical protein